MVESGHAVRMNEVALGRAVMENLEDRMADVVRHYNDAMATEKASVITIKVTVAPKSRQRDGFSCEVESGVRLAPRERFQTELYSATDEEGQLTLVEFNPRQLRMFEQPGS